MHSSTDSDRLKFCSALSAALTARVIVSQEIKSAIKEKMSRIRRAFFKNTVPFDQILFQSSYILETLEGNLAPRVLKKWFIYFFGWWNILLLRTSTCSECTNTKKRTIDHSLPQAEPTCHTCCHAYCVTNQVTHFRSTTSVAFPGRGGITWPIFGYRRVTEGLKPWPCLGQKKS